MSETIMSLEAGLTSVDARRASITHEKKDVISCNHATDNKQWMVRCSKRYFWVSRSIVRSDFGTVDKCCVLSSLVFQRSYSVCGIGT